MRRPSGDHAIPRGASAVRLGSLKIAETVSGFVCAWSAATDETRMQRTKARRQEQEGTKANSDRRNGFLRENELVYRRGTGIRAARQWNDIGRFPQQERCDAHGHRLRYPWQPNGI